MENQFSRTEIIIGKENINKLQKIKVAIFGLGGVGASAVEALARSGIGKFILVDNDKVNITNLNRQIIATHKTIGRLKTEVTKERILEINPKAEVEIYNIFYLPGIEEKILDNSVDYIVDAIDTIKAKIELVMEANKLNIPIISSMGTGNKMQGTKFEVTDIFKTSVCPLAKHIRQELRKRNIKQLKVVYSKEEPIKIKSTISNKEEKIIGSMPFVPPIAGMIIAGEVIKDICNI